MKITKTLIKLFLKNKLATNEAWALRAMVRVYGLQTMTEQCTDSTNEINGVGFSGPDAAFLTSLTKQYERRGSLSPKQMAFVFKKMPRYWSQVSTFIGEDKLKKLVEQSLVVV